MSILHSLLLGLLQGLTEFLPVSSSGHLVLVPWLLNWPAPGLTFDVLVHLGTLLAVVSYFWRDIMGLVRAWWESVQARRINTAQGRLAWLIILSALPGAVLGALFDDWFESMFASPRIVSILLLVTGLLLVGGERLGRRVRSLEGLSILDAVVVGLGQAIAIAPGISRSGATISLALVRDLKREDAARFSFLMAIPIVAGAAVMQVRHALQSPVASGQPVQWVVGFVAALLSGYLAIRFLLQYVRAHSLLPFAYYCWAFGLACLILTFVR